jgi:catechol 2,3-dioxygenase-like lactoylglutathione lyase family enzyme
MNVIHHSAICTRHIDRSLVFWTEGLGFEVLMDEQFDGDWATLLHAPSTSLRSIFLGDPGAQGSGIVELVDLGDVPDGERDVSGPASSGFLLLSVMTDVPGTLRRLRELGLGGSPRQVEVSGVTMAVVTDPNGVLVELIDTGAASNLERLSSTGGEA